MRRGIGADPGAGVRECRGGGWQRRAVCERGCERPVHDHAYECGCGGTAFCGRCWVRQSQETELSEMSEVSSRDNYRSAVLDRGRTLEFLERLGQSSPTESGEACQYGFGAGGTASSNTPNRPVNNPPGFDPNFRQVSRASSAREQSVAGHINRQPIRGPPRRCSKHNYAKHAQRTTALYDCLSRSRDADYAVACRKAYLLCLKAGGYAQQSGTTVIFNFPTTSD